jgi:hypothetical protein
LVCAEPLRGKGMRRFRISELVLGLLLGFASLLIIFLLGSNVTLREIGSALNDNNGIITAVATIFIAWFTLSLRQSTDKLWDAGERQLKLLAKTSADQSRGTQAAIDVAERALVAGERAWIRVDVQNNGDFVFNANGIAPIRLLFTLTNTGNSPATKVQINVRAFLGNFLYASTPREEYQKICDITRRRGENPTEDGLSEEILSCTLFPGEIKQIPVSETMNAREISDLIEAWKERTGDEWKFFAPHIVGCVSYWIPFDDRQHQTGFMYVLERMLPDFPGGPQWGMFNIDDRRVNAIDMRLFDSIWGSQSSD